VVTIDHDEARRWFEKAASQGHEGAEPRLAALARLQEQQPAPAIQPPRAGTGS
jgi:TPR repeat protein